MKKTINIQGMMCAHCAARVKNALEALGAKAEVSAEKGTAAVECEGVTDAQLKTAVEDAGYDVTSIE